MAKPVRHEVIWAPAAAGDLDRLIDYLGQDHPSYAEKTWRQIKTRAHSLSLFPLRGRLVPELKTIGLDLYRELIIYPYRLVFRVKGKAVLILALFDGRRDLEEVLLERLTQL